MMLNYTKALLATGRFGLARQLLQDYTRNQTTTPEVYNLLAQSYSGLGQEAESHRYLAEYYYASGQTRAAILQLRIARKSAGDNFYINAVIDERLKQFLAEEDERRGSASGMIAFAAHSPKPKRCLNLLCTQREREPVRAHNPSFNLAMFPESALEHLASCILRKFGEQHRSYGVAFVAPQMLATPGPDLCLRDELMFIDGVTGSDRYFPHADHSAHSTTAASRMGGNR
ncbi:MAG: hypothetical protein MZW92_16655 [Comamonadaceae bacterium]|nr:hypothetical protein [Comamonadaceae bacterium]